MHKVTHHIGTTCSPLHHGRPFAARTSTALTYRCEVGMIAFGTHVQLRRRCTTSDRATGS
eukprot:5024942-Pyramimonas_sp.AAC.1